MISFVYVSELLKFFYIYVFNLMQLLFLSLCTIGRWSSNTLVSGTLVTCLCGLRLSVCKASEIESEKLKYVFTNFL